MRLLKLMFYAVLLGVLIGIIAIGLTGCSRKIIPVSYGCPTVKLPPDPADYLGKLDYKSTPDEVMQGWVATALAYRNWNKAVRYQVAIQNG